MAKQAHAIKRGIQILRSRCGSCSIRSEASGFRKRFRSFILRRTMRRSWRKKRCEVPSRIFRWTRRMLASMSRISLSVNVRPIGGPMLKRIMPAPMGRAFRIRKRSNHLTIVVGDEPMSGTAPKNRKKSVAEPRAVTSRVKKAPAAEETSRKSDRPVENKALTVSE